MTLTSTPCDLSTMSLFQDLKLKRRKIDSRCSSDGESYGNLSRPIKRLTRFRFRLRSRLPSSESNVSRTEQRSPPKHCGPFRETTYRRLRPVNDTHDDDDRNNKRLRRPSGLALIHACIRRFRRSVDGHFNRFGYVGENKIRTRRITFAIHFEFSSIITRRGNREIRNVFASSRTICRVYNKISVAV